MNDGNADNSVMILRAIQGARHAQARQSALLRSELHRMMTRDDFSSAMSVLAETINSLEEALNASVQEVAAQLAAIAERLAS